MTNWEKKLCHGRQHRTSNSRQAAIDENSLMVHLVKSSTEVYLHNPIFLSLLTEGIKPNTAAKSSGRPLMRTLSIHQNVPVSDTKLTPSFCIDFITPPLAPDKFIPVNSRMLWILYPEWPHRQCVGLAF